MPLEGEREMRSKMRRIAQGFPGMAGRALYQEVDEVETPEVKMRTPVKTGALRASEHTEPPEYHGHTISVSIVAGGPSAPYALKVHEDLEAFHPVGQAKYIESVVMESAPFMLQRVARRMDIARLA